MKFHPFSIKYVEKIKNSNEIIFHDDIQYDKFELTKDKHLNLTMSYTDTSKNIENIYALMHTDISNYLTSEKNFLLHGDIYFIESYNIYAIFSFNKYLGSSSIMSHGFFFLDSELKNGSFQLIFNSSSFKTIDEFFTRYNQDDIEYVGNLFIHDVESFMPEPFTSARTYKVDSLREKSVAMKDTFQYYSCFDLIEKNEDEYSEDEIKTHHYQPGPITIDSVRIAELDSWEIQIERFPYFYDYRIGVYGKSSIELTTSCLYECKLKEDVLKEIQEFIYDEDKNKNKNKRFDNYMKFFVFYTHKGIAIQSLVNDSLESFYFDDIPIGFDVWDSFNVLSDKNNKRYIQELLKII